MDDIYNNKQIMELVKEQAQSIRKLNETMIRVETGIEYIKKDIGEIKESQKNVDDRLTKVENRQSSTKFFDNLGQSIVQYVVMAIVIAVIVMIGIK